MVEYVDLVVIFVRHSQIRGNSPASVLDSCLSKTNYQEIGYNSVFMHNQPTDLSSMITLVFHIHNFLVQNYFCIAKFKGSIFPFLCITYQRLCLFVNMKQKFLLIQSSRFLIFLVDTQQVSQYKMLHDLNLKYMQKSCWFSEPVWSLIISKIVNLYLFMNSKGYVPKLSKLLNKMLTF